MQSHDLVLIHPPYHPRNGSGLIFPLGLGYIASAAIKAGFSVRIIDGAHYCSSIISNSLEKFLSWLSQELSVAQPRLAIGIGPCTTSSVRSIKGITEVCKLVCPSIPMIFGGPLASIPRQEKLFFDEFSAAAFVPGDGEYVIGNLLETLNQNRSLNTVKEIVTPDASEWHYNIVENLDLLQFPYRNARGKNDRYHLSVRRDLFHPPFATMVTSRGCPYKCPFCMSGILRKGRYHRRSFSNVIKEIEHLQSIYNVNTIVFYDDTFFPSSQQLSADVHMLAKSIKTLPRPIYWEIEMRPNVLIALDIKLVHELFRVGCRQINIGIEKGWQENRSAIGKDVNYDELRATIEMIRKAEPGMRLTATFILGGPDETTATIEETIKFSVSLELLFAHYYPLEVYPGTSLFEHKFPNVDSLWWYKRIMKDDLPWGEIIYEGESIGRTELLESVNNAYKTFYNRISWHDLAQQYLGKYYKNVTSAIEVWEKDRFALGVNS